MFLSKYLLRTFLCRLSRTTTMPYFSTRRHQLLYPRSLPHHPFTRPAWRVCRHIQQPLCAPSFHLYLMNWRFSLASRFVFWPATKMDGLCVWIVGGNRAWCRMSVWIKALFLLGYFLLIMTSGFRKIVPGYPVWRKLSGMSADFFLNWSLLKILERVLMLSIS